MYCIGIFHFIYADQEIVDVKIPLNKGGLRGLWFFFSNGCSVCTLQPP